MRKREAPPPLAQGTQPGRAHAPGSHPARPPRTARRQRETDRAMSSGVKLIFTANFPFNAA